MESTNTILTDYQATFYNEWLQDPTRTDYNMVNDFLLSGQIDAEQLNSGLIRFVSEHLLFNSNVINDGKVLMWRQRNPIRYSTQLVSVYEFQLSNEDMLKIVSEPFDLEHDLLVRYILIKQDNGDFRFINIQPHILVDGLSGDELINEFSKYYNSAYHKNQRSLVQQRQLHNDLSTKFNKIRTENQTKIADFWQKHLSTLQSNDLRFISKSQIDNQQNRNSIDTIDFFIEEDLLLKIKSAARKVRLTPYVISQMALAVSLNKYTGQSNIGISFPTAVQEGKELIYGAHVNTLIIDFRFSSTSTLEELIEQTLLYYNELKLTKAKYLPIGYISKYLEDKRILDFAFAQTNLRTTPVKFNKVECKQINDDLHIDMVNNIIFEQEFKNNGLHFKVRYRTTLFDSYLINSFIDNFKNI